jgi:23S rRNA (uracil1939-C5)-methyltransferase
MELKKGTVLSSIRMETMAAEGKCVAHYDGRVLFTTGCAPGDVADVELTKIKTNFLEGKAVKITTLSPDRDEPFCMHFGLCGGCSWQHIQYRTQLTYKHQQVIDNLERIGGLELPPVNAIIGSARQSRYRNRLDFTFTASRWMTREELDAGGTMGQPGLGFHIPKMYDRVFNVETCHLMDNPVDKLRNLVRDTAVKNDIPFFDLRRQVGYLRTLTIRMTQAGEMMVILQVAYDEPQWLEIILDTITANFPEAHSVNYIINGKRNDTFHDLNIITWKGDSWITEKMERPDGKGQLNFRIGPKSFYQTNSLQAEVLYKEAWKLAGLTGSELVYDLYTGTGTIANYIAADCKKVIGLEYVAAAVEDAKVNAQLNGNLNTDFYAGDMKDLLSESFILEHGKPDVIITDPPRAGMHEDVVKMLLRIAAEKIVYISCNPATQARDLKWLSESYRIAAVQPVDMFPQTMHVENIVLLIRK